MKFDDLLKDLKDFRQRVLPLIKLVYSKLEVGPAVDEEALQQFCDEFPFAPDPALLDTWRVASSVVFEWFVKAEGANLAGMDSRLAPTGQFILLSPSQALREFEFLAELGGVSHSEFPMLPFAKLQPNGELIAIDHTDGQAHIVLVILDMVLSVLPLAENMGEWYAQRIQTYFEDSTLDPACKATPTLTATLDCFNSSSVEWPPEKQGW